MLLTSCRTGSSRAASAAGGPGGYRVQVPGRADLAARGAEVSGVFHDATGVFHHAGTTARVAGPAPGHNSYGSFISFEDPDGNGWLVQEITTRLPGR